MNKPRNTNQAISSGVPPEPRACGTSPAGLIEKYCCLICNQKLKKVTLGEINFHRMKHKQTLLAPPVAIAARKKKIKLKSKKLKRQKSTNKNFYTSRVWLNLRYRALTKYGRICMLCQTRKGQMHVDHIKPRSLYPKLELDFNNLQILCRDCNLGKENKDQTDFRFKAILPN